MLTQRGDGMLLSWKKYVLKKVGTACDNVYQFFTDIFTALGSDRGEMSWSI